MDFSNLFRHVCQSHWFDFPTYTLHTSTFLPPFAPHPLRCLSAPMEVLTPGYSHSLYQVSLIHAHCLPAIPSPTTQCSLSSLYYATPQLDRLPSCLKGLGFAIH